MRCAGTWVLVALTLLGCPSDDVMSGEASGSRGSTSEGTGATSAVSATGMLPPPATSTDSSSSGAVDSTSGTTADTSGTTNGAADDDPGCFHCCGNGVLDDTEQCECETFSCTPEELGFAECPDVMSSQFPDRVYTGGVLDCNHATCLFDLMGCTWCGDGTINGNETCEPEPPPLDTCASLGLGDAIEPLPCDQSCQIDTSSCL